MKRILSVLAAGVVLAGCGGGGGSDEVSSSSFNEKEELSLGSVPGLSVSDPAKGPFTVLGTIDKLTSDGLVLSLNNQPGHISVGKGPNAFLFGKKIPMNAPYAVTVENQPINPTQFCTVANGTGIATKTVDTVAVSCAASTKFAIVAQKGAPNGSISTFAYDPSTGALSNTPKATTAFLSPDIDSSKPISLLRHPNNSVVYVASEGAQKIVGYAVGEKDGTLIKSGNTLNLQANEGGATLNRAGSKLFTINKGEGRFAVATIDGTGKITGAQGYTVAGGNFQAIVGGADDKHVYIVDGTGVFRVFGFDSSGLPVDELTITGYGALTGLAATPNGKFAYASVGTSDKVSFFKQDVNGVLNTVPAFYFPGNITNVTSLTIDPTGSFLFGFDKGVSSASAVVWKIDQATGALTFVSSTPVDLNTSPDFAFDNVGHFVYITALNTAGFVRGFSINAATGALTEVTQPATGFESVHAVRLY